MRDFREQNHYELLEVHPKVNQQELESSYRRLRKIFSPDSVATYALFQADELNLLRRRIEEAFRTLSDPDRRSAYDQELLRFEDSWIEVVDGKPGHAGDDQQEDESHKGDEYDRDSKSDIELKEEESHSANFSGMNDEEDAHDTSDEEPQDDSPVSPDDSVDESLDESVNELDSESVDELPQGPSTEPEEQVLSGDGDLLEQGPASQEVASSLDEGDDPADSSTVQMPIVDESTDVTGALLKQAREAKEMTLDDYVKITKISIYYLRNIENEDFSDLPAPVYIRGYLQQMARILGLDPVLVAKGYMDRMTRED